MNEEITTNQKPYSQINFEGMATDVAVLVRALIPFAEMDRPGELKQSGVGGDEELQAALEERVLQRGHGPDRTWLTNSNFRDAAKTLFDLTEAVPEAYWSYGIKFDFDDQSNAAQAPPDTLLIDAELMTNPNI